MEEVQQDQPDWESLLVVGIETLCRCTNNVVADLRRLQVERYVRELETSSLVVHCSQPNVHPRFPNRRHSRAARPVYRWEYDDFPIRIVGLGMSDSAKGEVEVDGPSSDKSRFHARLPRLLDDADTCTASVP